MVGTMSAQEPSRRGEILVVCSGAFRAAYEALQPGFERATGNSVATAWGSSVAGAPTSIPARLEAGQCFDLVIMAGEGLDRLIVQGYIAAADRVDLARSGIGVAVPAGAPRPDLSSTAALIGALRQAKSVAHSASASGIYLKGLFARLGLTEALGSRIREVKGEPVGAVLARGEAEIGFQQISELLPVPGIEFVGPLPPEIQHTTLFAAGIVAAARAPQAARAFITYLGAPAAAPVIRKSGMEPA
jgi:molybdate transport system substrate-binding protein